VPAIAGIPLRAVSVELSFLRGEAELTAAIEPVVERARVANDEMFDQA
jgi:hypothetical protein